MASSYASLDFKMRNESNDFSSIPSYLCVFSSVKPKGGWKAIYLPFDILNWDVCCDGIKISVPLSIPNPNKPRNEGSNNDLQLKLSKYQYQSQYQVFYKTLRYDHIG